MAEAAERAERVPVGMRVVYGFGSVSEGTKNTMFNVFLLFYYNQVLGLPGTLAGLAIALALCVDAVTDPLIGSLSDSHHSRWGRRHPFMYASALPMAVSFYLLFVPPAGLGHTALFAWLAGFAILVRASMTAYSIPSNSMVAEMTPHYDERTSLVSYRFLFGWLGGLTVSQLGYLYFLAPTSEFADGRYNAAGYGAFGVTCAVFIFVAISVCALGTHRLIPTLKPPPAKTPFSTQRFGRELRDVFGNRSYLMLVFASLFGSVAGGFSDVVGLYMSTYFWELSTQQIAVLVWGLAVAALVAVGAARPLSERLDKRRSAIGLATFAILFSPLLIFLRLLELLPANGHPALLPLIFVHSSVLVGVAVVLGILFSSMIADTVDENELTTGKRQEGMFSSAIAFTSKATSGVGGLLAGVALDVIAFPSAAPGGVAPSVPPEKVFALGLVVGPGLMLLFLCSLAFLRRYRITRGRYREIHEALAQRDSSTRRNAGAAPYESEALGVLGGDEG